MLKELTMDEMMMVDGGKVNWNTVAAGFAIVGVGIAIAATGGLATVPIAVIAGAGTAGEIAVATVATGGVAIGEGINGN